MDRLRCFTAASTAHPAGLPKPSLAREDRRTEVTTLQNKMHGTRGNVQSTAKFVAATGVVNQDG